MRPLGPISTLAFGLALAGCQSTPQRSNIEKNLMTERQSIAHQTEVLEGYRVGCPDEIELRVEGRGDFNQRQVVAPDGCIDLGRYGRFRIEGQTVRAIAQTVADRLGVPPASVKVRVADFDSRFLIVIGEVVGQHRTIPYRGEETVLDVLQRVGGITPGAEPTEVYVVRSHLGDIDRPEVFHVDLQDIVLKKNPETNIHVLPYDQIFVGETRQARIEKCLPPWLKPTYKMLWDMLPGEAAPAIGDR
ncbi:MAG TPA: polysaccharide biosynthesis/export family protein [Gemmataceae bacterium]|jgi:protein involved in polysaccharide export with SLBB domain|nr:polysaccharide biosynthesis/export family protein [Gemmataceae bacterium]